MRWELLFFFACVFLMQLGYLYLMINVRRDAKEFKRQARGELRAARMDRLGAMQAMNIASKYAQYGESLVQSVRPKENSND